MADTGAFLERPGMFGRLLNLAFRRNRSWTLPDVPEGMRIYAVGDIHGRLDLLEDLHEKMVADAATADSEKNVQIFVGDYVDRGPDSKDVVDWLIAPPPEGWVRVCLKGNHEVMALGFLDNPETLKMWKQLGGLETLRSYGVDISRAQDENAPEILRTEFTEKIPEEHRAFFSNLPLYVEFGSYLFVHAGIRPGIEMPEQNERDLLWIRKEFLTSKIDFGRIIIHGHTPVPQPEVLPNRINIDTGAFMSDKLTCLVLERDKQRFL